MMMILVHISKNGRQWRLFHLQLGRSSASDEYQVRHRRGIHKVRYWNGKETFKTVNITDYGYTVWVQKKFTPRKLLIIFLNHLWSVKYYTSYEIVFYPESFSIILCGTNICACVFVSAYVCDFASAKQHMQCISFELNSISHSANPNIIHNVGITLQLMWVMTISFSIILLH